MQAPEALTPLIIKPRPYLRFTTRWWTQAEAMHYLLMEPLLPSSGNLCCEKIVAAHQENELPNLYSCFDSRVPAENTAVDNSLDAQDATSWMVLSLFVNNWNPRLQTADEEELNLLSDWLVEHGVYGFVPPYTEQNRDTMVRQLLKSLPAPTTTPAEPSHVGEITIEDISDHTDTGTMEETEPISAVEPENEDGERHWKDTFEKTEAPKLDSQDIVSRLSKYLSCVGSVVQIPIAEAMVMCRAKSGEEDSSQILIPFISEVKIGSCDIMNASMDFDDTSSMMVNSPSLSSSPPNNMSTLDKPKTEFSTPPSSPNVNVATNSQSSLPSVVPPSGEFVELQVDYWTTTPRSESSEKTDKASKKDSNKCTLKTTFRSLQVQRLAQNPVDLNSFSMVVVTKEKKHIMMVDGVEWTGVKFFQLSTQWQTHIKHFPIAILGNPDPV
uniref:Phosphofurin acidic cluster sorting protein 2 n=1 Tax=Magallana gigas TaxID=29159 RepID=K1R986_MAGGI